MSKLILLHDLIDLRVTKKISLSPFGQFQNGAEIQDGAQIQDASETLNCCQKFISSPILVNFFLK